MYQINRLYALNLHNVKAQLHLNSKLVTKKIKFLKLNDKKELLQKHYQIRTIRGGALCGENFDWWKLGVIWRMIIGCLDIQRWKSMGLWKK